MRRLVSGMSHCHCKAIRAQGLDLLLLLQSRMSQNTLNITATWWIFNRVKHWTLPFLNKWRRGVDVIYCSDCIFLLKRCLDGINISDFIGINLEKISRCSHLTLKHIISNSSQLPPSVIPLPSRTRISESSWTVSTSVRRAPLSRLSFRRELKYISVVG